MDPKARNKVRLGRYLFLFLSFSGLVLIILTWYLNSKSLFGADSPGCRVVWMGPSYARIVGFDETHTKYASKYSLYLYREQGKDMIPNEGPNSDVLGGIPVLFIPGNAGSYRQVRSIASETSNIYFKVVEEKGGKGGKQKKGESRNYDFFSADFNEDFTAFHGRTLQDQAEYLNEAIKFILSLYKNTEVPPKSVLIVGHSMGGIVARVMLTLPNYVPESVNTIVTLASPHAAAPLTFDGDILRIYSAVDRFWIAGYGKPDKSEHISKIAQERLANVSLVSITGGLLDSMLPADYTTLGYLVPPSHGFTVYTTGIPTVWTPIDHLAIVWCSQLRQVILRTLLDIANYLSPYKTLPLEKRMTIMKKRLLSGFENYVAQDFAPNSAKDGAFTISLDKSQYNSIGSGKKLRLKSKDATENSIDIHLLKLPQSEDTSFNLVSSKPIGQWLDTDETKKLTKPSVLLCKDTTTFDPTDHKTHESPIELKSSQILLRCIDAAEDIRMVPKSTSEHKKLEDSSYGGDEHPFLVLRYNSSVLGLYSSVLVIDCKTKDKDDFIVAEASNQTADYQLGTEMISLFGPGVKVTLPQERALVTNIRIPGAWSSLLVYKVCFAKVGQTKEKQTTGLFTHFIRQWSEDPYEVKWHIGFDEETPLLLSMHGIAPYTPFKIKPMQNYGMNLEIWADDSLKSESITVQVNIDIIESLRLLVLRYRLAVVSYCVAVILLALIYQLENFGRTKTFPSLAFGLSCICNPASLMVIIPILLALTPLTKNRLAQVLLNAMDPVVLQDPNEINMSLNASYKLNSFFLGLEENCLSFIGPLFFIMAVAMVLVTYGVGFCLLQAFAATLAVVKPRLPSMKDKGVEAKLVVPKAWLTRQVSGLVILLLLIPFYLPYQFAYVVCCLVQAIHSFKVVSTERVLKNQINYHLTLLTLMLWVLPVNVPILVAFVHNFTVNWTTPFSSHHNFLSIGPILMLMVSHTNSKPSLAFLTFHPKVTFVILGYFVFYCVVYGVRHTFWIHHLFNFLCCWLLYCVYNSANDE